MLQGSEGDSSSSAKERASHVDLRFGFQQLLRSVGPILGSNTTRSDQRHPVGGTGKTARGLGLSLFRVLVVVFFLGGGLRETGDNCHALGTAKRYQNIPLTTQRFTRPLGLKTTQRKQWLG